MTEFPPNEVLKHVVDVHCHPTDTSPVSPRSMADLQITVCAMASRTTDQGLVRDLATAYPEKIVPCFGYHPWFSHCITLDPSISKEEHYRQLFLSPLKTFTVEHQDAFNTLLPNLPDPSPLSHVLDRLRLNLGGFPNAMVGEVGMDRSFNIPFDFYERPRRRTPFNVPIAHQLAILESQLDVAIEMGRNCSIHSVHVQQVTVELLDRLAKKHGDLFYRISVNLHSCGLSPETWRTIEKKHPNVFISLSTIVNGKSANYKALIASCAKDKILAESDYDRIEMSTPQTWDIIRTIAEIKGWRVEAEWIEDLEEERWGVVHHLNQNWKKFQKGKHTPPSARKSTKHRRPIETTAHPLAKTPL